ncbi:MAG: DEAD/DEAH box helicase [Deltaproteobacteria bacterium]|jgi:ATP-dependent RNA helicase DeaD|nr:DEAD/DEAH box helicase [Deltaproteobacteria bacterium]
MTEPPEAEGAQTFEELGLTKEVLTALKEMGWETPTPVQRDSYPLAIAGHDIIVQSRTGTGKTGAFGIPLVDRLITEDGDEQALVLAPTRELALQSAAEIEKLGAHRNIDTVAVYGGASMERQVHALEKGARVISGTPGRVLDHLKRGTMDASKLRFLVLDEADEMLSMGFAKELHAIIERLPKERQTLLFSATVDRAIKRVAEKHMRDPQFLGLSGDHVGALGIEHFVYMVTGVGRVADLITILETEDPESALIFCNTKAETEEVSAALQRAGFNAEWLNGDRPQKEREEVLGRVRREELRFLVATDVAARGIDVSHLTHVINFSLPENVEQYVHRTGRTGRAGRTGTAITLVGPNELGILYYLRLQYRIFPVERTLPSAGEQRTRQEADRIAMIDAAYPTAPSERDLALVRRFLTHANAERMLAGLLRAFFGTESEEVDKVAAAKRRRGKQHPDEHSDTDEAFETTTLYVNIGRQDELKASELGRLLRDRTGLKRKEIGRIRVRDKHSLVDVPEDRAQDVIESMSGAILRDRELELELAKNG